jgi:hypothetical protein
MKRCIATLFTAVALATGSAALADAKFELMAVRVEQNATDNDFEVVFEATGGDTGMAALKVAAPDGRVVVDFKTPGTKLGMRSFRFETPEPKTLARLQADYPAGTYTFTASTVAGMSFSGTATLSHKLPAVAAVTRPQAKEQNVPLNGLRIQWRVPKDIKTCLLTIENDDNGVKVVQATLAGTATQFAVPDGVLLPGTNYKVSIGTVAPEGNAAYVETAFTTAKK